MIKEITAELFASRPDETVYHYTTFKGAIGIVESCSLWASDIRYMNDAVELKHTVNLIRREVNLRINQGHENPALLNQFLDWIDQRISSGHLLFAASFRANGNLLSQWRGYSTVGKGVSLGFDPRYIVQCCAQQGFTIGQCIYDPGQQKTLIIAVIDIIEQMAKKESQSATAGSRKNDYLTIFEHIESDILKIAALLKHPSFEEEAEWRIVSPIFDDIADTEVKFREGRSMIVPYVTFKFARGQEDSLTLRHVYLGPTPNIHNSMNSLAMFLRKHHASPEQGISYCQIPYRQQ